MNRVAKFKGWVRVALILNQERHDFHTVRNNLI